MKNLWYAGLLAAAVLALGGCDFFTGSGERADAGAAEPGMVTLNLEVPGDGTGSRALTDVLAKDSSVYYEAVFFDTTTPKYYSHVWSRGQSPKITIPTGSYDVGDPNYDAVLFAGKYIDATHAVLLATGRLSKVEYFGGTIDDTATPFVIDRDTKSVTFTLSPLTTDIGVGKAAAASSSFLVTDPPSTAYVTANNVNYFTYHSGAAKFPAFCIEPNSTNGKASFTIGSAVGRLDQVKLAVSYPATDTGLEFRLENGDPAPGGSDISGVITNHTTPSAALGAAVSTNVTFILDFDTSGITNEVRLLSFDIPVFAADETIREPGNPSAVNWFIRGGLDNDAYDTGKKDVYDTNLLENSLGGTIILLVADPSTVTTNINEVF